MIKKIISTTISEFYLQIAILLLRLTVAILMIPHGYGKLINFEKMHEKFMHFMGLDANISLALVIFAEFVCSIFLAAGLLTRFALIPLIITMVVAAFDAHQADIFGDGQMAFLYLMCYVVLLLAGAGKWSIDYLIWNKKSSAL